MPYLDGAEISSIEGVDRDAGEARTIQVRIVFEHDGVPAVLHVTAWRPGSIGYDPGAVSCSSMRQVGHITDTVQQPQPADLVSFGCQPELFPDQHSEWWVAAETTQARREGAP